jgi:hypothetical protein
METKSQNHCPVKSKSRFRTIASDELLYRELVVSSGTRRTQAVEDTGLGMIQIRKPQDDFAARWLLVLFAHTSGLHTAGMHNLEHPIISVAR